ncbi:MAG: sensor histidine kinase [Chloroflexota bacterium]|nr:sensor histidine kinase [Chloroflexota bacterium]
MAQRKTEIGLNKIFRGYCGFVFVYFLAFFAYTVWITRTLYSSSFILFYINPGTFAILFGYLSWIWLEKKLGEFYFPIAILIATLIPMYSMTYFWPFPLGDQVSDIVFRSWYLFPILVVPSTLIAWQYGYKVALVFILLISFYDLPFIVMRIDSLSAETMQLLGVPILRTIAFGTVGVIVGLLMDTQRSQRRKLIQANLQLGRHAETVEELAISHERNRLARELHDTLAHTLSSQILTLEALKLSPPAVKSEMDAALTDMIINAREGLAETRRALKDLRSKHLDDLGLQHALIYLMEDAGSRAHIETDLDLPDPMPDIPADIEQNIYRIAQEGVENILRHASATKINFSLKHKTNVLICNLEDNGSGFDTRAVNEDKHGICGMRERMLESGGEFKITSHPKRGTKITVKFEVQDDSRFSL